MEAILALAVFISRLRSSFSIPSFEVWIEFFLNFLVGGAEGGHANVGGVVCIAPEEGIKSEGGILVLFTRSVSGFSSSLSKSKLVMSQTDLLTGRVF